MDCMMASASKPYHPALQFPSSRGYRLFGEKEEIVGYDGLSIDIWFTPQFQARLAGGYSGFQGGTRGGRARPVPRARSVQAPATCQLPHPTQLHRRPPTSPALLISP